MQTQLSPQAQQLPRARIAQDILRSCVHCGFCNATCPTYQVLGDERDGPRGRIYLIKAFLETGNATRDTQSHLDRCLGCRSCETTCPSGVEYHTLLDIGRNAMEQQVGRPRQQQWLRWWLRTVVTRRWLFAPLLRLGRLGKPVLPRTLQAHIPPVPTAAGLWPTRPHARTMVFAQGCVQADLSPNTHAATARVLDRLGISLKVAPKVACCGAVDYHLNAHEAGLQHARRSVDAWWQQLQNGAEAIIQTASGCGAFVKDYAALLKDDPLYAEKAREVSARSVDLVEILEKENLDALHIQPGTRLAFHCPCTLQHALRLTGRVEALLRKCGFDLTAVPGGHLCCGSAGTYSITQPELSVKLRNQKMDALESGKPELIATANIGCQTHLSAAGRTPVSHWIEVLDAHMQEASACVQSHA